MTAGAGGIAAQIAGCRACAADFAATATAHEPRPVVWFRRGARILVAGQAPGARVHASGRPFDDASGVRLRDWMGVGEEVFYDRARIAVVPMAFCFPGYDARGADLPPPPRCAGLWREAVMADLGAIRLTLLIGGAAQRWHMGRAATAGGVTATVAAWRAHAPQVFPLPHPSWRNTGWLARNPWFGDEVLPALRAAVAEALTEGRADG
jgi:uracil-DNA glycosylase